MDIWRLQGLGLIYTSSLRIRQDWTVLLVLAVGLATNIPSFVGSWWCLDDWGLLAQAKGYIPSSDGIPARYISQHLFWQAVVPVLGLNSLLHALLRGLIHSFSAVALRSICLRIGISPLSALIAALLFAASPISFTPVFWAAGVQELLGVFFGLLAVDQFFNGKTSGAIWATLWGGLSILSKEAGLGLPLFFFLIIVLVPKFRRRPLMFGAVSLSLLAMGEALLVLKHFATGPEDPYSMGGPLQVLYNLGMYCYWLLSLGAKFTSQVPWGKSILGLAGFAVWGLAAIWLIRRKRVIPIFALVFFMLGLAPALVLVRQTHPYLAYFPAAALYVCIALLVPGRWRARPPAMILLGLAAAAWGFSTTNLRISDSLASGLPADPIVRATGYSRQSSLQILRAYDLRQMNQPESLVFLQPPITPHQAEIAHGSGPLHVVHSPRYAALAGPLGPTVILQDQPDIHWVNSLVGLPKDSLVMCETGKGFLDWGDLWTGLLYSAIADVSLGHFERARLHFTEALRIDPNVELFSFDESRGVSVARARANYGDFVRFLESPVEGAGFVGFDRSEVDRLFSRI